MPKSFYQIVVSIVPEYMHLKNKTSFHSFLFLNIIDVISPVQIVVEHQENKHINFYQQAAKYPSCPVYNMNKIELIDLCFHSTSNTSVLIRGEGSRSARKKTY